MKPDFEIEVGDWYELRKQLQAKHGLIQALCQSLRLLGRDAGPASEGELAKWLKPLLAATNSYGDSLTDEEVTSFVAKWNLDFQTLLNRSEETP